MKLKVKRNDLLDAVSAVIGVVERRQTLPVLANVLLDVADGQLTVVGTDLELELEARTAIQVDTAGRVTVPGRKLHEIVKSLPAGADITLDASDRKATLRSGASRFTLACLSADEFPSMGRVQDGQALELPQKTLRGLIERTEFAIAVQDVRYYLNGLLMDVRADGVRAVATDGHRLAFSEAKLKTEVRNDLQVIVPRKAVLELQRLLGDVDDPIKLSISSSQIEAQCGQIRLTSKLIDGRFPDYEPVIPEAGGNQLVGNCESMRRALARAAILVNEKVRGIRLVMNPSKLVLRTDNPEQEEAEEEVETTFSGTPMEIGFNVNYLIDVLGVLKAERFSMDLKGSDASGLLYADGDLSSKYVIMPMRI